MTEMSESMYKAALRQARPFLAMMARTESLDDFSVHEIEAIKQNLNNVTAVLEFELHNRYATSNPQDLGVASHRGDGSVHAEDVPGLQDKGECPFCGAQLTNDGEGFTVHASNMERMCP